MLAKLIRVRRIEESPKWQYVKDFEICHLVFNELYTVPCAVSEEMGCLKMYYSCLQDRMA